MSPHPAYETLRPVLPGAAVLLQANPGPMTLDGTNTWLLRAAGASSCVVVDPGEAADADEADDAHLSALVDAAGPVELILLTHGHHDHSGLAGSLHSRTGAPVRAVSPSHCRGAGSPLADGETLRAAGVSIGVIATPGHTADSVSFVLDSSAVLTGDTILGRGTTVVAYPDGVLGPYLTSLARLRDLGDLPVLPGHGPDLPSVAAVAAQYLEHREQRLEQVRAALRELGPEATARQIVELVYADVDQALWRAAELSVRAQLDHLRG